MLKYWYRTLPTPKLQLQCTCRWRVQNACVLVRHTLSELLQLLRWDWNDTLRRLPLETTNLQWVNENVEDINYLLTDGNDKVTLTGWQFHRPRGHSAGRTSLVSRRDNCGWGFGQKRLLLFRPWMNRKQGSLSGRGRTGLAHPARDKHQDKIDKLDENGTGHRKHSWADT